MSRISIEHVRLTVEKPFDAFRADFENQLGRFDPSAYEDEYRTELLSLIERKAAGEDVLAAKPEAPKATKAPDLMAALEESLAAIKGEELSGDGKREAKPKTRKSPAKKPASKAKSKSKAKAAK